VPASARPCARLTTLARYAREHNGANVLALGSTLVTTDEALGIVDTFLTTAMTEPRYMRRLAKIAAPGADAVDVRGDRGPM
jgi:ribose 5-phosphate isomerase B